jgi:hypothetical protein
MHENLRLMQEQQIRDKVRKMQSLAVGRAQAEAGARRDRDQIELERRKELEKKL